MPSSNRKQTPTESITGEAHLIYRGGCRVENLASEKNKLDPILWLTDVAGAMLSRDYKGLSNYPSNAVIEVYRIENE